MRKQQGFTLIELMIVVAVIAILSAIAFPSYTDYVMRGRRAEANERCSKLRFGWRRHKPPQVRTL